MRPGPTSDSATCSRLPRPNGVLRGAAVVAAALVLAVSFPMEVLCWEVQVFGVPGWLAPGVDRTVRAVWGEMGSRRSQEERLRLLDMVCSRLFEGYRVESSYGDDVLTVKLTPLGGGVRSVEGYAGQWRDPVARWLAEDVAVLEDRLLMEARGVPREAFIWGRRYLDEMLGGLCGEMLPGWRAEASLDGEVLRVRLYPSHPMVISLSPRLKSSTLPAMLLDEMRDDAQVGAAAFVGLPVEYLRRRGAEGASYVAGLVESSDYGDRLLVTAQGAMRAAPLGDVEMRVDSRRYVIWAWVAAHAGSDQRSSEGGLHLGRRVKIFPAWDMEAYGEWVVDGRDLSLESRWGLRWQVMRYLWAGAEISYPGGDLFLRINTDLLPDDFYWHVAFGPDGRRRGGLGRRLSEHFSVELYYDSRDQDSLSLKFLNNL